MQEELANVIDTLYTTHSDVERREIMAKLTAFLTTPQSWSSLLNLFMVALGSTVANSNEQKRRQRICFFAGNALLSKIKKEPLQLAETRQLVSSIHGLMISTDSNTGQSFARDPSSQLLGKATLKRLVLCLATLASSDPQLVGEYVEYAITLCDPPHQQESSPEVQQLGLDMLLAIANPGSEDEDNEDAPQAVQSSLLTGLVHKVITALEGYVSRLPSVNAKPLNGSYGTEQDQTLALETLRAYLRIMQTPHVFRVNWPNLFEYSLSALSTARKVETMRASAGIFRILADFCKVSGDTATIDSLIRGIVLARPRFQQLSKDEDACNAIASAFAKVAESDVNRIARGKCPLFEEMIDFSVEILAHPHRSAVSRNSLDFFLCVQDVPLQERAPRLNETFFLRLLGHLVISCQLEADMVPISPEEEEGADDVLLYRGSSDGPRDLFASVYAILSERYVRELVAIVANSEFDYLRSEAALFALRCSAKEICQMISKKDVSKQQQRLALFDLLDRFLRISFRREMYFRSSMCATIADFSSVLHLLGMDRQYSQPDLITNGSTTSAAKMHRSPMEQENSSALATVSVNLEYVLANLEDPAADLLLIQRACGAFQRLCSRHAKLLAPFIDSIFSRMVVKCQPFMSNNNHGSGHTSIRAATSDDRKTFGVMLDARRLVAEGFSRLCTTHQDPFCASRMVIETLLVRVNTHSASALELCTVASFVKFLPPDVPKVVDMIFATVWPLLDACFTKGLLGTSPADEQIEALSELINSFFFCCSSRMNESTLDAILGWVVSVFHERPMSFLANNVAKAVELYANGILTQVRCAEVLRAMLSGEPRLLNEFQDTVPAVLDTLRRIFLFIPESIFGPTVIMDPNDSIKICEFVMKCLAQEERETIREACVVLSDFINRTRKPEGDQKTETRWSVFSNTLDQILGRPHSNIVALAELIAGYLARGERQLVAENLSDLLYHILRAYPISTVQSWTLPRMNGTDGGVALVQCARTATKEGFRRYVSEKTSHGSFGVGSA